MEMQIKQATVAVQTFQYKIWGKDRFYAKNPIKWMKSNIIVSKLMLNWDKKMPSNYRSSIISQDILDIFNLWENENLRKHTGGHVWFIIRDFDPIVLCLLI